MLSVSRGVKSPVVECSRCHLARSPATHEMHETMEKFRSLSAGRIQAELRASGLAEERPGHLDVAGHSDLRVALQRIAE